MATFENHGQHSTQTHNHEHPKSGGMAGLSMMPKFDFDMTKLQTHPELGKPAQYNRNSNPIPHSLKLTQQDADEFQRILYSNEPVQPKTQHEHWKSYHEVVQELIASPCCVRRTSAPMLSDFQVVRKLGKGAFGQVLLATEQATGTKVALKILEKRRLSTNKRIEHAMNERNALQLVECPFAVKLVHAFQDDANLYLALEFVEAGEFFNLLQVHGPLAESTARFFGAQLVLALGYFQRKNLIHRDIKPENIMMDCHGYIKITDFGFSKFISERTWSICGTPEYTAPEIVLDQGHDLAVDWWSVGILLFEIVAGYSPFQAALNRRFLLLKKIIEGKVRYPMAFSQPFRDVLGNLLRKNPQNRLAFANHVYEHRWFADTEWNAINSRTYPAPLLPEPDPHADSSDPHHSLQPTF
eukprot:m.272314 g.272314  ORF g.272314 m.272314 type:complete len:412 (-) comp100618_c0_seq1:52-1287(-)